VFTDADLPYGADVLLQVEHLVNRGGCAVVVGDRHLHESVTLAPPGSLRRLANRAFSMAVRLLISRGLNDTQCGLKGFRGDVAEALFPLVKADGFSGDVEMLVLVSKNGLPIERIPVQWVTHGESTVCLPVDALQMLFQIASLRWRLERDQERWNAFSAKAVQSRTKGTPD
jgi:hypothetical protein